MRNNQKIIIFAVSLIIMTAMYDMFNELKALEDLTDNLRFLFRYEEQLIQEGWYTESEFLQAVLEAIEEWQANREKE